jgi:hypothetical protein
MDKIDAAITQKFKELEDRLCQVLGLVDPYFRKVINKMLVEHKGYIMEIFSKSEGEKK